MRLLQLLTYCAVASGLAFHKLDTGLAVRAQGELATTGSNGYDADGILSRDSSAAWIEAEKTAIFQKKFKASYLHVRRLADNPNTWTQTRHGWDEVKRMQRIDYGGTTTSSKGNLDRVVRKGEEWIALSGG
ncbi:hypothetical protein CSAL01_07586 [Colletotrichum salicis]|uniref:Uncharacterized protein n=1 Tax=Colletotrichum salicis TaxID=1209931 RepID=A0A135S5H3_9PEZI|nr:hypothetical protein CSAL01_07586 [Colletotrichum salicis]